MKMVHRVLLRQLSPFFFFILTVNHFMNIVCVLSLCRVCCYVWRLSLGGLDPKIVHLPVNNIDFFFEKPNFCGIWSGCRIDFPNVLRGCFIHSRHLSKDFLFLAWKRGCYFLLPRDLGRFNMSRRALIINMENFFRLVCYRMVYSQLIILCGTFTRPRYLIGRWNDLSFKHLSLVQPNSVKFVCHS
jgi:hypothetical protein